MFKVATSSVFLATAALAGFMENYWSDWDGDDFQKKPRRFPAGLLFCSVLRRTLIERHAAGNCFRFSVWPGRGRGAVNRVAVLVRGHDACDGLAVRAGDAFRFRVCAVGVH